jgi:diaminopimelate epimerase
VSLHTLPFIKAHGTGNDFIVIPDLKGEISLDADDVRYLCDRHFGLGADGVIRITPMEPDSQTFFMDYRNADGSLAEMCGNGARIFVAYLFREGLVNGPEVEFGTRAGMLRAHIYSASDIEIDMGVPSQGPEVNRVTVSQGGQLLPGASVHVPNPHAVVEVAELAGIGTLCESPLWEPVDVFPEGVNVEFVEYLGPGHVRMRVWERGVGETLSCGTGACAVGLVSQARHPEDGSTWRVDVPGGTVFVRVGDDHHVYLRGPVTFVAEGLVELANE